MKTIKPKKERTAYDVYAEHAKKAFNFPSKKLVSDGDIITVLKKTNSENAKLSLSDAVNVLRKNLNKDKGLRESYKANIAMAYKDNESWYKQDTGKKTLNKEDRHIIANNAAEYFLQQLCS